MKAAALTAIGKIEIVDIPKPQIKDDNDVLVRIQRVGLCGSDMHYYRTGRIGSQIVEFPFVLGHECAGVVEQVGSAVQTVRPGQQVAIDPAVFCGRCDQCLTGRANTCRELRFLGCPGQMGGSLCQYLVMPQQSCFAADRINLDQAVLAEPLAISLYAVKQAQLNKNAQVAVLGAGPIGLGCALFAKWAGVENCLATELIQQRMDAAKLTGADIVLDADENKKGNVAERILAQRPDGLDVVFECAGQQQTLDQAVQILKPGGKLMMIGIPEQERVSFVIDAIRRKELTLINVRRQNDCTAQCIEMLETNQVRADFMITHHFDLQQISSAFDVVANYRDGVIKAMVTID